MEIMGLDFNRSYVDRVERCLQSLRKCDQKRVIEIEELLDYLLWDVE
jgi:hypothetical protein